MNTNEIRDAAERLLTEKHYNYWECNNPTNAMTDSALLAKAYLAEHPSDSAEPVTIGFNAVCELLINKGYLKGKELIAAVKPSHGSCCTCQTCGEPYEDCVCEHNRLLHALHELRTDQ